MFGNIRSLAAPVERTRADYPVACEQALLFGQAKRASRERFAARSRVLTRLISLVSLAQIGELARRLTILTSEHQLLKQWRFLQEIASDFFLFCTITRCFYYITMYYKKRSKSKKEERQIT